MNLLALLPDALKVVGKVLGIGNKVEEVANAIAGGTPEQRAAMQQALLQHEAQMRALDVEAVKALVQESIAASQSDDRYISRVRPTGLYIGYAVVVALTIGLLFEVKIDPTAILTIVAPLFGAGGYYMHLRTKEKMHGGNGH